MPVTHLRAARVHGSDVGPAGHWYVYFIYGMYADMLNVVASHVEDVQAVLICAAEPLDGWGGSIGSGKARAATPITEC